MSHTPGPWKVIESGSSFSVVDSTDKLIRVSGISQPCGYVPMEDESCDNGRLLAAAPELLEACKAVAYESDRELGKDILVSKIRLNKILAAIDKAEGRS